MGLLERQSRPCRYLWTRLHGCTLTGMQAGLRRNDGGGKNNNALPRQKGSQVYAILLHPLPVSPYRHSGEGPLAWMQVVEPRLPA